MNSREKENLIWVILAALICVGIFYVYHFLTTDPGEDERIVRVGFVLDGDESTPYSENFIRAIEILKLEYGDRINVIIRYNVPYEEAGDVLKELADMECNIIFTNSYGYGETAKEIAKEYPDVEFCEATCDNANEAPVVKNYHTFMGRIYEGRYICGLVAGMKMQEMIDKGKIEVDEAVIGYVGAYPYAEVISGYTAFFLGARQTCPSATMRVRYTNTWTSYMKEKEIAAELIDEGCVIISQHSDTVGPAVTCENSDAGHPVYHVGYNQDMIDVAPTTSLIGTRIDWAPYICAAVGAVVENEDIESQIKADVHGNDSGAGFDQGWVSMLELNAAIAPEGSAEVIDKAIEDMKAGKVHVFKGDYIGMNPDDPHDTWDLNTEYPENREASAPGFHYVLTKVITIEE